MSGCSISGSSAGSRSIFDQFLEQADDRAVLLVRPPTAARSAADERPHDVVGDLVARALGIGRREDRSAAALVASDRPVERRVGTAALDARSRAGCRPRRRRTGTGPAGDGRRRCRYRRGGSPRSRGRPTAGGRRTARRRASTRAPSRRRSCPGADGGPVRGARSDARSPKGTPREPLPTVIDRGSPRLRRSAASTIRPMKARDAQAVHGCGGSGGGRSDAPVRHARGARR